MSKPLNTQIIERARALIGDEKNWCRGELARDAKGTPVCPTDSRAKRRCALGAFIAAAYEITTNFSLAHDLAFGAVRSFSGITTLVNINDVRGHAAVLKQLDDIMDDVDQGMPEHKTFQARS
jgi:hypothetical protein